MTRGRWVAATAFALILMVGAGALARELLPLRSILGLTNDSPCVPSLVSVRLPENSASAAGRWEDAGVYPVARDEVRATEVAGEIYVGTGVSLDGGILSSLDEMFRFDPERGTYVAVPPVPSRVDHAAFVGHQGALYVIGGYIDEVPTDAAWRYSPKTERWEALPPLRSARGAAAAAAVNGKIYLVGGSPERQGTVEPPMADVEVYDIASGEWTSGPSMPTARHHHGVAAVGGLVVVVGGRSRDDLSVDAVEQFDPATRRWTSLASLPLGAGGLAVVPAGEQVVAIGGGDDDELWVTPAAWSLDRDANEWRRLADLNVARHGLGAAAVENEIYVFGGAPCPGYGRTDVVESLSVPVAASP